MDFSRLPSFVKSYIVSPNLIALQSIDPSFNSRYDARVRLKHICAEKGISLAKVDELRIQKLKSLDLETNDYVRDGCLERIFGRMPSLPESVPYALQEEFKSFMYKQSLAYLNRYAASNKEIKAFMATLRGLPIAEIKKDLNIDKESLFSNYSKITTRLRKNAFASMFDFFGLYEQELFPDSKANMRKNRSTIVFRELEDVSQRVVVFCHLNDWSSQEISNMTGLFEEDVNEIIRGFNQEVRGADRDFIKANLPSEVVFENWQKLLGKDGCKTKQKLVEFYFNYESLSVAFKKFPEDARDISHSVKELKNAFEILGISEEEAKAIRERHLIATAPFGTKKFRLRLLDKVLKMKGIPALEIPKGISGDKYRDMIGKRLFLNFYHHVKPGSSFVNHIVAYIQGISPERTVELFGGNKVSIKSVPSAVMRKFKKDYLEIADSMGAYGIDQAELSEYQASLLKKLKAVDFDKTVFDDLIADLPQGSQERLDAHQLWYMVQDAIEGLLEESY